MGWCWPTLPARSLGTGHRVIHGAAGAGKTLILVYRCLHLARALRKPILVVSYNRTLAGRLQAILAAKGAGDQVVVYSFAEDQGVGPRYVSDSTQLYPSKGLTRPLRETLIYRRFPAAHGCAAGIDHRRWLIPRQAANPFASAKAYRTLQRRAR